MTPVTAIGAAGLRRLHVGGTVVQTEPAVFEVRGSGALTCLQGLITNDLEKPGTGSAVYGALLTGKGAIIADVWALRLGDRFLLVAEPAARTPLGDLLRRSLPPRLAKVEDRTGSYAAAWLLGPASVDAVPGLPGPGHVHETAGLLRLRPTVGAPFQALLLGPAELIGATVDGSGLPHGDESDREATRILAGWPRLGAEIGERTLVQEVRYDEIGGVSYTKGCYTGQETVARLHFRGHTNRELRGLLWEALPTLEGEAVIGEDARDVGHISSLLALPDRLLGLALLRRGVEPGASVIAGGHPATVVALPFHLPAFLHAAG